MPELVFTTRAAAAAVRAVESVGKGARELKKVYGETKDVFGSQGQQIVKVYTQIITKQKEANEAIKQIHKSQKNGKLTSAQAEKAINDVAKAYIAFGTQAKAAIQDSAKQWEQLTEAERKAAAVAAEAAEQRKKLAQDGKRLIDEQRTGQERIAEKLRELKRIYRELGTDTEGYNQAVSRLTIAWQRAGAGGKKPLNDTRTAMEQLNTALTANATAQSRVNDLFTNGKISIDAYTTATNNLLNKQKTLKDELAATEKPMQSVFGGAILGQIKSVALGVVSVYSAIQLARKELTTFQEVADRSGDARVRVGKAANFVLRNMVGASATDEKRVLGRAKSIAGDLGVSEEHVLRAMGDALSASSGNEEASANMVRTAFRYLPGEEGEASELAGTLLDMGKVTGSTSGEKNLGFFKAIAGYSRLTSLRQQQMNIAPAVIGLKNLGATPEQAAALYASVTTAAGDKLGAFSKTGSISLAQQLRAFDPGANTGADIGSLENAVAKAQERLESAKNAELDARVAANQTDLPADRRVEDAQAALEKAQDKGDEAKIATAKERLRRAQVDQQRARDALSAQHQEKVGGVSSAEKSLADAQVSLAAGGLDNRFSQELRDKLGGLDFDGRLKLLQSDEKLARQFIDGSSFEKEVVSIMEQLLLGKGSVSTNYDAALAKFSQPEFFDRSGRRALDFSSNPYVGSIRAEAALESFAEQTSLGRNENLSGAARGSLRNALLNINTTAIGTDLETFAQSLSDGKVGVSTVEAESLVERARKRYSDQINFDEIAASEYGGARRIPREATPEEKRQLEVLQNVEKLLENILKANKEAAGFPGGPG